MLGTLKILNVDRRVRQAVHGQPDRRRRRSRPFPAAMQLEALDARQLMSAGDLDSTFGSGGVLSLNFGTGDDFGYAVAVQSDGRILVAGTVQGASGTTDFGLARLNADGSLDASFGSGGMVVSDLGTGGITSIDEVRAMALDASGRIYVCGFANRGVNNDFAVARYNSDGSMDVTFGTGGVAVNSFNGNDQSFAMAIQGDGKVLLAGLISNDFGIARYNTDGTLDATFGTGGAGFVRTAVGSSLDAATAIAVLPDGRILAGGYVQFGTNFDFAAARYNSTGTPDTTLNGTGRLTTNLGSSDQATSVAIMPDGRFVLAGRSGNNVGMARYNANGSRDLSFGTNGMAVRDLGGTNDAANAMMLQPDGSILLAGVAGDGDTTRDFALMRFTPTGAFDATFGTGSSGFARTDFAGDIDQAFGMASDAQGRLILVGRTTSDSFSPFTYDFAVARYTLTANEPPTAVITGDSDVSEGSSAMLDGSSSFDNDGSITSFEWDFDYDGSTFDVDATGSAALFSAIGLDGPSSRTVALRVTDDQGAQHIVTHAMGVTNVAPSLTISGSGSASEGSAYALTLGEVSDPGIDSVAQYVIHWGDGSSSTIDAADMPEDRTIHHTYADGSASHAITVDLVDEDGTHTDRANAHGVDVTNVAPALTISGSNSAREGSPFALTLGPVTDPGMDSVTQYIIHWGDGSSSIIDAADMPADRTIAHTYADGSNSYSISVDLVDEDGTHAGVSNSLGLTVDDVAPSLSLGGSGSVSEGSEYALELGPITDPGMDSITQYVIHWGDGSSSTIGAADMPADRIVRHTYTDGPASYAVTVDLVDEDGTHQNRAGAHGVSVDNVAPSAALSGPATGTRGQAMSFTVNFADPGSDAHTVRWEFSDGTIIESSASGGSATISHAFASTGDFTVSVTVSDDDGGFSSSQMSVSIAPPRPVEFVDDPERPGKKMVIVNGGIGRDEISFRSKGGKIEVRMNGRNMGLFNGASRIIAYGNEGNDVMIAVSGLDLPVEFHGGEGNDRLGGSNKNDLLDGGEGDDLLFGRQGNDQLIGGGGRDRMFGGRGDDTMIGGAGRDHMHDARGRNVFEYDDEDWQPKKAKKGGKK